MVNPSIEKCEEFAAIWDRSDSLLDAFSKARHLFKTNDQRGMLRIRRAIETKLDRKLEAHNPQHFTDNEVICPSTLDHDAAKKAEAYVLACATNNSPLVKDFFAAIKIFAEAKKAQIIVVPARYKNPNAKTRGEDYIWPDEIIPYALTHDLNLSNNLTLSSTKVQATKLNPLASALPLYQKKSFVLGHPQLAMKTIGTPKHELPKKAMTTGSISRPRYSDSDAGIRARSNHSISALYVIDEGDLYREFVLEWDGSGFHFFDERWTVEGKSKAKVSAIHFGDVHARVASDDEIEQRLKLVKHLEPEYLIYNDLHDHGSQSHHLTTIEMIRNAENGQNKVEDEVQLSADVVNKLGVGRKNLIVQSNHHDHIDQWLNRFDPRKDPLNATYAFWLINECVKTGKTGLEIALNGKIKVKHEFVGRNKSKKISGVDVSQHGDVGVDGARSAVSLGTTGMKICIGHVHRPFINKKIWASGTVSRKHGYAKGYSSWLETDTIIYKGGARAHVNHIKGSYWT